MKALLLKKYMELEVTDLPEPEIGPDDVLVRVSACGICGRDVNNWKSGDRVTFDSTVSCGRCQFCRRGEINLCDNRQVLGVSCGDYRRNGAFAEYVAVPHNIIYRMPEGLPFEHAA